MNFEKLFCDISTWIYWYQYDLAKKELKGDGEDTKELAYEWTHNTLSSAGFSFAYMPTDEEVKVYVLDTSPIYCVNKNGETKLVNFIKDKVKEKYNVAIRFYPLEAHRIFDKILYITEIYDYTKPYIENLYGQIKDSVISWEEAFELNQIPTKEELEKEREELINKLGNLLRHHIQVSKLLTAYRPYITQFKKDLTELGVKPDFDTVYEPGNDYQVAYANLLFYQNAVSVLTKESINLKKDIRYLSKKVASIEKKLGYKNR